MVIDSSAIIAILHGEPEAHAFVIKLAAATTCRLSAANYVEAGLVLKRDATGAARRALETLLADFQIVIEPVSANQAKLALAAYDRFGKGTGHYRRYGLPPRCRGLPVAPDRAAAPAPCG